MQDNKSELNKGCCTTTSKNRLDTLQHAKTAVTNQKTFKKKSKSAKTYLNSKTEVELRTDDLWRTTAQVSAMHCGVLSGR